MPNTFAHIALLSWPLVAIFLFRRFSLPTALVWTILGGYLFLPSRPTFDFPFLPAIDKTLIPSVMAAVLCMLAARRIDIQQKIQQLRLARAAGGRPGRHVRGREQTEHPGPSGAGTTGTTWVIRILIAAYLIAPVLTAVSNPAPLATGGGMLPGLGLRDAFSGVLRAFFALLPFFLARRYLADGVGQTTILRGFCIAGLIYSLAIIFELRMSPQLNVNLYGYFSHSFAQHVRSGGWRPIVFLQHGLWVGIFLSMSTLAAMALFKQATGKSRLKYLLVIVWMVPILVLSKNLGALMITTVMASFLLLTNMRTKLLLLATVAVIVLSFPALRGAGLIPVDKVYSVALQINVARANSLHTRLVNEDSLLAKANQKPFFGWGGWNRSRIFDPQTGRDISIADGVWVITIGVSGWFGYIATFGLLCIPTFLLAWRRRTQLSVVSAGLAFVLGANLIDLIPNATLTPLTWLVAGAIAGYCQRSPAPLSGDTGQPGPVRQPTRYARASRQAS